MTDKPRTFLPIAARLRIGTPFVLHYKGLGEGVATFHDQQAAEAIETLYEALEPMAHAALGLSYGEDWNNGTAAKTHGYRKKLLAAIPAAIAALEKVRTMGEAPRSKKEAV